MEPPEGKPLHEEDRFDFSRSTPIKMINSQNGLDSAHGDILGHSTQSILRMCELMGDEWKRHEEIVHGNSSFTLNPTQANFGPPEVYQRSPPKSARFTRPQSTARSSNDGHVLITQSSPAYEPISKRITPSSHSRNNQQALQDIHSQHQRFGSIELKSQRLTHKPIMYSFDIYIRAAVEI